MPDVIDKSLRELVALLSEAGQEWLQERAAILEYEAGMTRADAEAKAYRLTCLHFGAKEGDG